MTAFENELGVQAPVGFWDPVGFTADGDVAAFKRRRSVELKHGRISMMAAMGTLDAIRFHEFVCLSLGSAVQAFYAFFPISVHSCFMLFHRIISRFIQRQFQRNRPSLNQIVGCFVFDEDTLLQKSLASCLGLSAEYFERSWKRRKPFVPICNF